MSDMYQPPPMYQPPDDDQEPPEGTDDAEQDQDLDEQDPEQEDGEQGAEGAFATMEGRVQQATEVAQEVVRAALPTDAPVNWHPVAHQELIIAILRDWSRNSTEELVEEDVSNLSGFTRIAADAGLAAPAYPDETFVAVLRSLLEDWVANWSGGDDDE